MAVPKAATVGAQRRSTAASAAVRAATASRRARSSSLAPRARSVSSKTGADGAPPGTGATGEPPDDLTLREQLDALERNLIAGMLARTGGNQSEAARRLGLSRTAFIDRMKKYGLG